MRSSLIAGLALGLGLPVLAGAQSLGTLKPAGKEPTLAIGGLLQIQFDGGDRGDSRFTNDNDRFYLRRARLNATGKFLEEFDFRLEMDLAGSISNTSALRAQMTDGFITWNRYPEANVRVGQLKTPFGFEQLYGDPRLYTIERSLANDRLTLSRQIGTQVAGEFLEKRFTYAFGAFNGNSVNNNFNDDDRFLSVGRIVARALAGEAGLHLRDLVGGRQRLLLEGRQRPPLGPGAGLHAGNRRPGRHLLRRTAGHGIGHPAHRRSL